MPRKREFFSVQRGQQIEDRTAVGCCQVEVSPNDVHFLSVVLYPVLTFPLHFAERLYYSVMNQFERLALGFLEQLIHFIAAIKGECEADIVVYFVAAAKRIANSNQREGFRKLAINQSFIQTLSAKSLCELVNDEGIFDFEKIMSVSGWTLEQTADHYTFCEFPLDGKKIIII